MWYVVPVVDAMSGISKTLMVKSFLDDEVLTVLLGRAIVLQPINTLNVCGRKEATRYT